MNFNRVRRVGFLVVGWFSWWDDLADLNRALELGWVYARLRPDIVEPRSATINEHHRQFDLKYFHSLLSIEL